MVRKVSSPGLIVSTAPQRTAALNELVQVLDWPIIDAATPRRLRDAPVLQDVECLLFWLEEHRETNATVNLVAWLRDRLPGVYRILIAYSLDTRHEAIVRSAGVQMYVPAMTDIGAVVEDAVLPILNRHDLVRSAAQRARAPTRIALARADLGELREVEHPP